MRKHVVVGVVAAMLAGLVAAVASADSGTPGPITLKGHQIAVDEANGLYTMTGSLVGKWDVDTYHPLFEGKDGQLVATGKETFIGCHDLDGSGACDAGEPDGRLRFLYVYWATFEPKTHALVRGECMHPIVGGTGGFVGAKGFVHMWDRPAGKTVVTTYTGSIQYAKPLTTSSLPGPGTRSLASIAPAHGCGGR
jgi:hypothetical protein